MTTEKSWQKSFLYPESTRIEWRHKKNLCNTINGENNNPLPPNRSSQDLAQHFYNFLSQKVAQIVNHLQTTQILYHHPEMYHNSDYLISVHKVIAVQLFSSTCKLIPYSWSFQKKLPYLDLPMIMHYSVAYEQYQS